MESLKKNLMLSIKKSQKVYVKCILSVILSIALFGSTMSGVTFSSSEKVQAAEEQETSKKEVLTTIFDNLTKELDGEENVDAGMIANGVCGEKITWTLYNDGKLVINGTGEMYDFDSMAKEGESNAIPWLSYRKQIKSVVVEEGVTSIGASAFYNTLYTYSSPVKDTIENISLPKSLNKIGELSLYRCNLLSSIEIPKAVTFIGANAFGECTSLERADLPDELIELGNYAFEDCTKLSQISLPEKLEKIGEGSFSNIKIEKLTIPDTIKSIDINAFKYCRYLKELTVEGDITLSQWAFADCESLEKINFKGKVSSDSCNSIFQDCNSIREATIPSEYMCKSGQKYPLTPMISGCSSLDISNIIFTDGAKWIDGVLFSADEKKLLWYPATLIAETYDIPYGVESIGACSFEKQQSLKHVGIPDSVKTIQSWAFQDCTSLDNVVIPDGVKEIYCFQNCKSLKSIIMPSSVTYMVQNYKATMESFYSDTSLTMYCESGSYAESFANENSYFITPKEITYCNFDANGGTNIYDKQPVIPGDKYWVLPTPTRDNYKFEGWYTSKTGGNKVTIDSVVGNNINYTLYAHWTSDIPNKLISNTTITLSVSSYTYDGTEKTPTVIVKDGSITLENGTDYFVTFSNNVNAGIATVTINGIGNYSGLISKMFTINKATPTLTFENTSVSKKTGDEAFTNTLNKKTDGTVTFSSTNTKVATVNSTSGKVTIKGTGSATITASSAEGTNYAAGFASYTLNIFNGNNGNIYNLGEENYSFENYRDSDSYGGHCFGMSVTSSGYYLGCLNITDIGLTSVQKLSTLSPSSKVKKPICYYQNIQGSYSANSTVAGGSYYLSGMNNIKRDWAEIINYVKSHNYDNTGKLQIGFRAGNEGGHAINFLYYKQVNGQDRIYAYDNNFPYIETYFYMNSSGNVVQAPKSTFSNTLTCIALRDVETYYSLVDEFSDNKVIYAEPDNIYIPNVLGQEMEGSSMLMYELPDTCNEISIVPLRNNADFTYMDNSRSFGTITNDTYAELNLENTSEDSATGTLNIKATGRISIDPCYYGHTFDTSFVSLEPTCTDKGIRKYICSVCNAASKEESIPAKGHKNTTSITRATPVENGKIITKCSVCANTTTRTIYHPKKIALSSTKYTYNDKVQKPSVIVKDANGKTIKSSNYTVYYSNKGSKEVGKYAVKITFKGNYSGKKTLSYTIIPMTTVVKSVKNTAKKIVNVTWKKNITATGYQIQYVFGSKATSKTVTKKGTVSLKLTKLTRGKTYKIRIRAYKTVGNTTFYSAWSEYRSVKITK